MARLLVSGVKMATNVNIPRLVIPTGFENQQIEVDRKRRIADAMLARGLTPQNDMRHWAQLVGQMAQAWAGKSMQRGADRQQQSLNDAISGSYQGKLNAFRDWEGQLKRGEITVDQLVQEFRGDPMLEQALEPYTKAMESRASADQRINYRLAIDPATGQVVTRGVSDAGTVTNAPEGFQLPNTNISNVNGVATDLAATAPGTILPQSATDVVVRNQSGNFVPNVPAIMSTRVSQGFGGGIPTSTPDPGITSEGPTPANNTITREEAARILASMNGDQQRFDAWRAQTGVKIAGVPQAVQVDGKTYYIIDGRAFDNPEGR